MSVNINQLPHEMIEYILSKLPVKDLLQSRLVSLHWKELATPLCRNRYVRLTSIWYSKCKGNLDTLMQIFRDPDCIPWSCVSLDTYKRINISVEEIGTIPNADSSLFVQKFGPYVRKLVLYFDKCLFTILGSLQNLEQITFYDYFYDGFRKNFPDTSILSCKLPKMKKLKLHIKNRAGIKLVEVLISMCGLKLNRISVHYNLGGDQDNTKLATLLTKFGKISVKLDDSFNNFRGTRSIAGFCDKNLKIQKLSVNLRYNLDYILPLQTFIAQIQHTLQKLVLEFRAGTGSSAGVPSLRLQIPNLPELKTLKVVHKFCTKNLQFLIPFTPQQLPQLENVTIKAKGTFEFTDFFGGCIFQTVWKLELTPLGLGNQSCMKTDWIAIFPNVKKLFCHGAGRYDFQYIFTKMTKLEHLGVELKTSYHEILCGFPLPKRIYGEKKEERQKLKDLQSKGIPSLLDLKRLRTLTIDIFSAPENGLQEATLDLYLLQMQPLEYLRLHHVTSFSEESISKLKAYHGQVEFTNDEPFPFL